MSIFLVKIKMACQPFFKSFSKSFVKKIGTLYLNRNTRLWLKYFRYFDDKSGANPFFCFHFDGPFMIIDDFL